MKPIKRGMTEAVTRDGQPVTKLTWFVVEQGSNCCAGIVDGKLYEWDEKGKFYGNQFATPLDIFAPVKKVTIERWVNVYPDGIIYYYDSKIAADINAGYGRIACVKLTGEYEE